MRPRLFDDGPNGTFGRARGELRLLRYKYERDSAAVDAVHLRFQAPADGIADALRLQKREVDFTYPFASACHAGAQSVLGNVHHIDAHGSTADGRSTFLDLLALGPHPIPRRILGRGAMLAHRAVPSSFQR